MALIRTWKPFALGLAALPALLTPAPAQPSFSIGVNVPGTNITQLPAVNNGFQFIPPDTTGAIGPNHFTEFTNGTFSVYSKTNGALIGARTSLTSFWTTAGVTGL